MTTSHHSTMTVLDLPGHRTAPARIMEHRTGPANPVPALPRRIDVHRIDDLVDELHAAARRSRLLEVDGSAVEMIDGAGLAALDRLSAETGLLVRRPSVALLKTAEYTGHTRLQAACDPAVSFEQAA